MNDLEIFGAENSTQKIHFIQLFRNHYNTKRKLDLARVNNMLILRLKRKLTRLSSASQSGGFELHVPH